MMSQPSTSIVLNPPFQLSLEFRANDLEKKACQRMSEWCCLNEQENVAKVLEERTLRQTETARSFHRRYKNNSTCKMLLICEAYHFLCKYNAESWLQRRYLAARNSDLTFNLFGIEWQEHQLDAFSKILESINYESMKILNLSGCSLTDEKFSTVVGVLKHKQIVQLDLSNNNFTGKLFKTMYKTELLENIKGVLDLREAFKSKGRSRNATSTEREELEFELFRLKRKDCSSCAIVVDDETVYCNYPVCVTSLYIVRKKAYGEYSNIGLTQRSQTNLPLQPFPMLQ
ncbi:uncharacterized protein LOC143450451 [Clavelina lepadiformis]|uniref:uncharacterized protein LOC143450451 n=1 Tax=Clavelina lepadiformis TaxID=159417 RepID=UPI004041FCE1